MKSTTSVLGCTVLIASISCQSPTPDTQPKPGSVEINTAHRVNHPEKLKYYDGIKRLPAERWKSARFASINFYPPLAQRARIGGDVIIGLEIEKSGAVIRSEFISGPAPLASFMESFGKRVQFFPEPIDQPGPWSFILVGRFDPAGYIGVSPAGEEAVLLPVRKVSDDELINSLKRSGAIK